MSRLFDSPPIVSTRSVSQEISEILRSAILKGIIQPNQRLLEESLAEEFNVSRTPVREALRRMEAEGLVEYAPQKGAIVRQFSREEIADIHNLRMVLEGYAIRLAANRIQSDGLSQLERSCASFKEVLESDHDENECIDKLNDLNRQFHSIVVQISGNQRLARAIQISTQIPRYYAIRYWSSESRRQSSYRDHCEMLSALREADGTKAEILMQEHIRRTRDFVSNGWRESK